MSPRNQIAHRYTSCIIISDDWKIPFSRHTLTGNALAGDPRLQQNQKAKISDLTAITLKVRLNQNKSIFQLLNVNVLSQFVRDFVADGVNE